MNGARRTYRSVTAKLAAVTLLLLALSTSALAQFPWAAPLPLFPCRHANAVKKGNWGDMTGRVVATDLAVSALVVTSHDRQVRLTVPPRIDLSTLKVGDKVVVHYIADKGRLRVWYLRARP